MSVIFIVLPLAILIAGIGVAACIWATRCGQFDDLETPALRVIADDDVVVRSAHAVASETKGQARP